MLQWIDNFQQYGTSTANMLNGAYAQVVNTVGLVTDPDPTAGGTTVIRLQCSDGRVGGTFFRKVLPSPASTMGQTCRMWLTQLPDSNLVWPQPIVFTDANNTVLVSLAITPTGTIQAWRGGPLNGTLVAESSIAIVANGWQQIEAEISVSTTTGTVQVRVEGITVLNATGLNTQGSALSTIANLVPDFYDSNGFHSNSTWQMFLKDTATWDTTGTYNNTFLGRCFAYSMRPNSDVSGTWSIFGGAGSAWASINETSPDDDTKYIYSPWPAATADVCGMTDLPTDATTVLGMMSLVRSRKSDGGDGNLQIGLVSSGTVGNGANRPITTAYTYWSDIFETDPHTGAPWSVAAANAAQIQLNRTL